MFQCFWIICFIMHSADPATASGTEDRHSSHSNSSPACNWEALFHLPDTYNCDFNDIHKDILKLLVTQI